MARLLRDSYLERDGHHVVHLATGATLRVEDMEEENVGHQAPLPELIELLDHGREGAPRAIVATVTNTAACADIVRRAAHDARIRGFLAIAVPVYEQYRTMLEQELSTRALLVIATPTMPSRRTDAVFLDAAVRSPRPHILLTLRVTADPGGVVREARAAYGPRLRSAPMRVPAMSREVEECLRRVTRSEEAARTGRHAAAERMLRETVGTLLRRGAKGAAAAAIIALGRLLLERGRAADADRAFEEAAGMALDAADEDVILDARIWQATARTDNGQLTAAESICRALLVSRTFRPVERLRVDAVLARILLCQGRVEEAAELNLAVTDDMMLDERDACAIGDVAVRVLLAHDRVFEAGQRARSVVTCAADAGVLPRAIAAVAHLRVLLATGDLTLAEAGLRGALQAAAHARTPLRALRARLLWADALRRAGRNIEAARELTRLHRMSRAAPLLLRRAIQQRVRVNERPTRSERASMRATPAVRAVPRLVVLAQAEEDDATSVRAVLQGAIDLLQASRIEVCSNEAGPVTTLVMVGAGRATRLAPRVLEAGIAIGPEPGDESHEVGVPVRLGGNLVAACVARWPIDRRPPRDAVELLDLVAALLAPRIEGIHNVSRRAALTATAIPELVGVSAGINEVRGAVVRAASAPFSVLIEGESGVGKELVARAIHHLSPRRARRFCDLNCAALPDELLESELFGHARGAFTGAIADKAGVFEEADGGTLFLDELADLSLRAQAKLLRVLQQHEVRRVGETFSRTVDVRLVTAANRDMRSEAAEGRFRQDLLYRLDVIRIRIPPLRERPEDVPLLAEHFWRSAAERVGTRALLSHGLFAALSRYSWPGNVRELQNVVAALAVAAPARGVVRPALLPATVSGAMGMTAERFADARIQFERRFVTAALARAGGSRSRAARQLGLSRQGLLKMMGRLGLGAPRPNDMKAG